MDETNEPATNLHEAVALNDLDALKLLLERGADIHAMAIEGETALYQARSSRRSAEVITLPARRSAEKDQEQSSTVS